MSSDAEAGLDQAPTVDVSQPTAPAKNGLPAMSVPTMPPPAPLLPGEQRAADGGVEPATPPDL